MMSSFVSASQKLYPQLFSSGASTATILPLVQEKSSLWFACFSEEVDDEIISDDVAIVQVEELLADEMGRGGGSARTASAPSNIFARLL